MLGPIIATASAEKASDVVSSAKGALSSGADRVELRIDRLARGEDVFRLLHLLEGVPLLVSGSRIMVGEGEIPAFRRAQELGAFVDVPFGENLPSDLWGLDRGRLVVSCHDFENTPRDLSAVLSSMRKIRAACYKVVPTARGPGDLLAMKDFLTKWSPGGDLCAFSMGAPGVASRVMCLAWGSAATYVSAPGCACAAPGQIGIGEMIETYRPLGIRHGDPLYGVAGWPLNSTMSPSLHNRWLTSAGLPGRMLPIPTATLEALLSVCEDLSIRGLAVTIPHKRTALKHLGGSSRRCRLAGACNTMVRSDGGWYGCNTDIYGIRSALRGVPKGVKALLLGSGGAASSAAYHLSQSGRLCISSRNKEAARELAQEFGGSAVPWERRDEIDADLIVNATPVGQGGDESPFPAESLRCRWVFDLVVREGDTPMLAAAKKRGISTIPGVKMLEAQARLQFKIFTGQRAPR